MPEQLGRVERHRFHSCGMAEAVGGGHRGLEPQHSRLGHVPLVSGAECDRHTLLLQQCRVRQQRVHRFHAAAGSLHGRMDDDRHLAFRQFVGQQERLGAHADHRLQLEFVGDSQGRSHVVGSVGGEHDWHLPFQCGNQSLGLRIRRLVVALLGGVGLRLGERLADRRHRAHPGARPALRLLGFLAEVHQHRERRLQRGPLGRRPVQVEDAGRPAITAFRPGVVWTVVTPFIRRNSSSGSRALYRP